MSPVLELPERPDTPEARVLGDRALAAGLASAVLVVALASVTLAGAFERVARPGPARPLPFGDLSASSWDGGAPSGGSLLVATRAENGAVATVRGGEAWRDYTLRARLRWISGQTLSLLVRQEGAGDGIACVLEGRTARIDVTTGGVTKTLASRAVPLGPGSSFDAVVSASGNRVAFSAEGVTLVEARVPPREGTAGIAVSDPVWGRARAELDYVRVERSTIDLPPPGRLPGAWTAEDREQGD